MRQTTAFLVDRPFESARPEAIYRTLLVAITCVLVAVSVVCGQPELPYNTGDVVYTSWAVSWDAIPRLAQRMLQPSRSRDPHLVPMHVSLLAYELEAEPGLGTPRGLFFDALGRELLVAGGETPEVQKPQPILDPLPDAVRDALSDLWQGPIRGLQYQLEWGVGVVAADWISEGREHGAKILPDGEVLYLEIPLPEQVPPPVLARAQEMDLRPDEIDARLVHAYALVDRSLASMIGPLVLPTGRELNRGDPP